MVYYFRDLTMSFHYSWLAHHSIMCTSETTLGPINGAACHQTQSDFLLSSNMQAVQTSTNLLVENVMMSC